MRRFGEHYAKGLVGRAIAAAMGFLLLVSPTRVIASDLRMALTFDDLPANSTRDDLETHREITEGLLAALAAVEAPAIGFVNENKLEDGGEVVGQRVDLLRAWLTAGQELGNHTYSHPSLFTTPLAEFERDTLAGERVLRPLLAEHGAHPRYFRHPFLNTGPTVEVRDALVAFLESHGYRVAPVTIDNQEWVFARAYDRAVDTGDALLARRIAVEYLAYMKDMVDYYEAQSEAILGRQLPQVLLLHANRLNAATLPDLLGDLGARGYRFITLDEALADPAYDLPDTYAGRGGITWLHRWALTAGKRGEFFAGEPPVPEWVESAAGLGG